MSLGSGSRWHLIARKDPASLLNPRMETHVTWLTPSAWRLSMCTSVTGVSWGRLNSLSWLTPSWKNLPGWELNRQHRKFTLIFDSAVKRVCSMLVQPDNPASPDALDGAGVTSCLKKLPNTGVHVGEWCESQASCELRPLQWNEDLQLKTDLAGSTFYSFLGLYLSSQAPVGQPRTMNGTL